MFCDILVRKAVNRKLSSDKLTKILTFVMAVIVFAYGGSKAYDAIVNNYKTLTVYEETLAEVVDAKMFVIHDETLVSGPKGGVIVPLAVNGEKVASGSEIAAVFKSEKAAENYSESLAVASKLEIYRKINNQVQLANLDLMKLSNEIDGDFISIVDSVYRNNFTDLSDTELSFTEKLSRKNVSNGHEVDCSNEIATLEARLEALTSSAPSDVITAPSPGFYVSRPDGYESVLTVEDLDDLTSEKLADAFKAEREEIPSDSIGKIINGFNWYIACEVDASGVSSLTDGKSVKLVLGDSDTETLDATVYSSKITDGNKCLLVFECSLMNERFATLRKIDGRIVVSSHTGLKIPKDSVRFDKEGNEGVYIIEGNLVKFNRITEVYSNDDYVIASSTGKVGYLSQYDEVVISGKELSNGKVLN